MVFARKKTRVLCRHFSPPLGIYPFVDSSLAPGRTSNALWLRGQMSQAIIINLSSVPGLDSPVRKLAFYGQGGPIPYQFLRSAPHSWRLKFLILKLQTIST
jgi:hypothetical protein